MVLRWLRKVPRRQRRWPLIAFLTLGLVLLLLWALVAVPALILGVDQVQVLRKIQDPGKQLDEVNGLRSTLAAVFAGLAVAGGAIVGALNFRETSRQNRAVLELQRRGQVTERFTKAIDQLGQRGDEKLDVRIGAVYALEQIARDSAELHWPIMEVLTAYLREHARWGPLDKHEEGSHGKSRPDRPHRAPADVQAIATVIARRQLVDDDEAGQLVDVHDADLRGVLWPRAYLAHADLRGARLQESDLSYANLRGANLLGADMRHANLAWTQFGAARLEDACLEAAQLKGATLSGADLCGARLEGANLTGAVLNGARLTAANLTKANLSGALLKAAQLAGTDMREANLSGAQLEEANLHGSDLSGALGLTRAQLGVCKGVDRAQLPADMH